MAEKPATSGHLLKVPEAALEARVSVPTMYRLVQAGTVPALRVVDGRGPIRIPASEFREWLYGDG